MMTKSGRDSLSVFLQQNRAANALPGLDSEPSERFRVRPTDPLVRRYDPGPTPVEAAPASPARDVLGEIVALLKEKGPLAASAVIDALVLPVGQVVTALEQLERYGLVRETRTDSGVTFSAA